MTSTTSPKLVLAVDSRSLRDALDEIHVDYEFVSGGAELAIAVEGADGLIISAAQLKPDLIADIQERAGCLRWLHLINAGHDTLGDGDLRSQTVLTYTPGAGSRTVAGHGLGLILALVRGLPQAMQLQRECSWQYGLGAHLSSLHGKTVMILGFGHIGRELARLLAPFNVQIVAVSRSGTPREGATIGCEVDEVDFYLPLSDIIVVCAPLNNRMRGFFDADRMSRTKRGACIVNLSRGGIIELNALAAALHTGWLGGAALDVTDPEPLPTAHPAWKAPNLIVTPHCAAGGLCDEDREHLVAIAADNASRFMEGRELLHVVAREMG